MDGLRYEPSLSFCDYASTGYLLDLSHSIILPKSLIYDFVIHCCLTSLSFCFEVGCHIYILYIYNEGNLYWMKMIYDFFLDLISYVSNLIFSTFSFFISIFVSLSLIVTMIFSTFLCFLDENFSYIFFKTEIKVCNWRLGGKNEKVSQNNYPFSSVFCYAKNPLSRRSWKSINWVWQKLFVNLDPGFGSL